MNTEQDKTHVYVIQHSKCESGEQDVFESVMVFINDPNSASEYCDKLCSSINEFENSENSVSENYWVEEHTVE